MAHGIYQGQPILEHLYSITKAPKYLKWYVYPRLCLKPKAVTISRRISKTGPRTAIPIWYKPLSMPGIKNSIAKRISIRTNRFIKKALKNFIQNQVGDFLGGKSGKATAKANRNLWDRFGGSGFGLGRGPVM